MPAIKGYEMKKTGEFIRRHFRVLCQYAKILAADRGRLILTTAGICVSLFLSGAGEEMRNSLTERQMRELKIFDPCAVLVCGEKGADAGGILRGAAESGIRYSYTHCRYGEIPLAVTSVRKGLSVTCRLFPAGLSGKGDRIRIGSADGETPACEPLSVVYGSFFTEEECRETASVCLLERSTAEILFGMENAVGLYLQAVNGPDRLRLKVTGIIEDLDRSRRENLRLNAELLRACGPSRQETDRLLFTPLTLFSEETSLSRGSRSCMTFLPDADDLPALSAVIRKCCGDAFRAFDCEELEAGAAENMKTAQVLLSVMQLLLAAVSGFMIMITMYFYVRSRFRETGIRRALGAGMNDIVREFVIQSVLTGMLAAAAASGILLIFCSYVKAAALYLCGSDPCIRLHARTLIHMTVTAAAWSALFALLPVASAAEMSPAEIMGRRT